MNCAHAQALLPEFLYGEVPAGETTTLEKHLAGCPRCRQAYTELRAVRRQLDRVPAPSVAIDLPRLYRQAADQQQRRARRWRRLGVALCGAAALFAGLALTQRLELHVHPDHLVLRWNTRAEPSTAPPAPAPQPSAVVAAGAAEEQLQLLSQLIHALAETTETRAAQQRQELTQLRDELHDLQRATLQWRYATARDVNALYTAHFLASQKGEKP